MPTRTQHAERLQVERRLDGPAVIVRAAGEIDVTTASLLVEQLSLATVQVTPPGPIVADLRDVEFFSCSGIDALLQACRRCKQQHTDLRVLAAPPVVRPLDLTGSLEYVTIYPTLTDALGRDGSR